MDVGLFISALEEMWRQCFGRMRVKSLEICHVFSISFNVCLLLALTYLDKRKDWVGGVFSSLRCK